MQPVTHSVIAYKWFRERLLAEHEDLDEETLADTLEGITDLHELIAKVVRAALDDEAHAEGLKGRLKAMHGRLERLEARAKRRRLIACEAMAECDIRKIEADDMTLSVRAGTPGLIVVDEGVIPDSYWKQVAPRLDRRGLIDGLKAGAAIAGVELSNPAPVLSVRVR